MSDRPPLLPDMDAMMDIVRAFETRAGYDPALSGARLTELLRLVPGKHAVLDGELDGRPAVFRFHIENAGDHARREWRELIRAQAHMSDGDLRVNAPLRHIPELGLVMVERVEGTPLFQHIWQADHDTRADYLGPAADWLRKYTAPTEARVPERAGRWITRARDAAARQPYKQLHPVEAAILDEIARIAALVATTPWRVAICHGDFHPNNLLINGPRITGIDTGGSAKLPIYKDMARFLSHMGRRGLAPSGTRRFGVDRVGLDAFARAFDLDEVERGVWLPFMIGVEALIRVETKSLSGSRIRRAKAFYEELLEELKRVGV